MNKPEKLTPESTSVYKYLVYGLSVPERALRSATGIVGGAVAESATLLVPMAFRNSRTYKSFVGQMLEFMINDVAGVTPTGKYDGDDTGEIEQYVAKKTVSSFIELAGMATLHVSPMTVLAVVSDVAYGSNGYLKELATELKKEGVIAESSIIDNSSDLLDAVSAASGKTADALSSPPLSVDGLRETIAQIRESVQKKPEPLISQHELESTWTEMNRQASEQNVSLFELSSAVTMATLDGLSVASAGALSTIRVSGNMFDRHIVDHYRQSLAKINKQGIYTVTLDASNRYVDAVWFNFSSDRRTITEELVSGELTGRAWDGIRGWITTGAKPAGTEGPEADAE